MRRLYRPLSKDKWRLTGAASIVVDTATPTVLKTDDREEIVVFSWSSVVLPQSYEISQALQDWQKDYLAWYLAMMAANINHYNHGNGAVNKQKNGKASTSSSVTPVVFPKPVLVRFEDKDLNEPEVFNGC
ncbi:hypothetical protein PENVUL_c053G07600 [Penicillium vulpinum]|uniref:Uncharacterized protein n=1 Tax=Penicillium vulpinum TaxID=29845 RepID=A0A1V6RG57_9EURO|nr:hypothetical protein PENVUL_c053G07600 [Penicillium vulpinum]